MILFVESNCPECKKKIFAGIKMGGETIAVAHFSEEEYGKVVDADKLQEKKFTV